MPKIILIILLLTFTGFVMSTMNNNNDLKFSHNYHVIEEEMECATCHELANQSMSGSDNLLPSKEICADCHDVEDESNCNMCHADIDNPKGYSKIQDYSPKFNHQLHATKGFDCYACHGDINEESYIKYYSLPNMINCMECHENEGASNECSVCHLDNESLVPANHVLDFKHNHGDLANNQNPTVLNGKVCSTCHHKNFCQECHEGDNLGLKSHPLNYQFTHALDAQGKEMECSVCHTERSFCIECHRDNNILPHNHKPGWTNIIQGDGGRHAIEAEIDIESCMACHEQNAEQICQPCHGK